MNGLLPRAACSPAASVVTPNVHLCVKPANYRVPHRSVRAACRAAWFSMVWQCRQLRACLAPPPQLFSSGGQPVSSLRARESRKKPAAALAAAAGAGCVFGWEHEGARERACSGANLMARVDKLLEAAARLLC